MFVVKIVFENVQEVQLLFDKLETAEEAARRISGVDLDEREDEREDARLLVVADDYGHVVFVRDYEIKYVLLLDCKRDLLGSRVYIDLQRDIQEYACKAKDSRHAGPKLVPTGGAVLNLDGELL